MNTFELIFVLFILIAAGIPIGYGLGRSSLKKEICIKLIESEQAIAKLTAQQSQFNRKDSGWLFYENRIVEQIEISDMLRSFL